MRNLFIIATVIAVLAATTGTTQPTAGETALLNAGGYYGNALVGMGRYGNITTILPLPQGAPSGIAVHERGGADLIVDGHNLYEYKNRVLRTVTTDLSGPAEDIVVLEDSRYALAASGHVSVHDRRLGTQDVIATGFMHACDITLNGSTGALMVIDDVSDEITELRGTTIVGIITVDRPRCMAWDPYTGNMFLACEGVLYHLLPDGGLIVLSEGTPGLTAPVGMFLRSDRTLLIAQRGNGTSDALPGVYAYHGDTGRFNRPLYQALNPDEGLMPADITVEHSRDLWAKSAAKVGQPLDLTLNFPQFSSKAFIAALSFGHKPGIELGWYRLHLVPDALFYASLSTPSLFQSTGALNADGNGQIRLNIPKIMELAGLRIFAGVVVPDANCKGGIGCTSYPMGFTIEK